MTTSKRRIWDISPAVDDRAGVFPGLDCGPLTNPHHIAHALHNLPPRVLLRSSAVASQSWASFTALAPATLALLASKKIAPGSIDTLSVDPATSQDRPSHHLLLKHGRRVLENLVLDEVAAGDHELIALPLKLTPGRCLASSRHPARHGGCRPPLRKT